MRWSSQRVALAQRYLQRRARLEAAQASALWLLLLAAVVEAALGMVGPLEEMALLAAAAVHQSRLAMMTPEALELLEITAALRMVERPQQREQAAVVVVQGALAGQALAQEAATAGPEHRAASTARQRLGLAVVAVAFHSPG